MKKLNQFLGICLFLFTISLVVVSCGKEDIGNIEENTTADIIVDDEVVYRDDNGGGPGPDGPEGEETEAYYSWIRCGSENTGGIVELKRYFVSHPQCVCWTEQWIYENCVDAAGSDNQYAYCEYTTTTSSPYGALCE